MAGKERELTQLDRVEREERRKGVLPALLVIGLIIVGIALVGVAESSGVLPVIGWALAGLAVVAILLWLAWVSIAGAIFAWPLVLICAVIGGFAGGGWGAFAGAFVGALIGRLVLRLTEGW